MYFSVKQVRGPFSSTPELSPALNGNFHPVGNIEITALSCCFFSVPLCPPLPCGRDWERSLGTRLSGMGTFASAPVSLDDAPGRACLQGFLLLLQLGPISGLVSPLCWLIGSPGCFSGSPLGWRLDFSDLRAEPYSSAHLYKMQIPHISTLF